MNDNELIEKLSPLYDFFKNQYEQNRAILIDSASPYSANINSYIRKREELNIYLDCSLKETTITRPVLVFPIDVDFRYANGPTNLERMLNGEAPYDSVTGDVIELHHIGQKFNSPFAELPRSVHCSTQTYSLLHDTSIESWRVDKELIARTKQETDRHWKTRGEVYVKDQKT